MIERYLVPEQAKTRPATLFEDLLGDSIERAFADGIIELQDLIYYLNDHGPSANSGEIWTEDNFQNLMKHLGK